MDDQGPRNLNSQAISGALTRRQVLKLAAAFGLAAPTIATLLAACGSGSATTPTTASAATTAPTTSSGATTGGAATAPATTGAAPTAAGSAAAPPGKGKILRFARNEEPGWPFIGWSSEDNSSEFTMINIYDGLVRPTKDGQGYEPALATKWEPSADAKTWTFTLRDAKFSDGKPVVAADVKASLDQARTSPKSQWTSTYKQISEVQAADDKTVKIMLAEPHPPLIAELGMWIAQVMPADMANAVDQDGYDTYHTRGAGAYMLDGWNKGEVMILKKNPYYWKGNNGPDEVHIEYIADDNSRILKLQGGQTDLIDFVPYSQIQSLSQGSTKAQAFPIQTYTDVSMNNTIKPLDDKNVRQALNYALDKDAIIKNVFFSQGQFQNSPIPTGTYWDKTLPGYPFNLDKAKQLMAASSVPKGFTFKQTVDSGNSVHLEIATILKDQWAKIGVTVEIVQLEKGLYNSQLRDGTSMAWWGGWTNDMSDPTEVANSKLRGNNSSFASYTHYNNPMVNSLIDQADTEPDPTKRGALYQQIQKIVLDDAPHVYICYPPATAGWQTYVTGFNIDSLDFYRFEDVRVNN